MTKRGWKKEPARHSLAAKGVKTKFEYPKYLRTISLDKVQPGKTLIIEDMPKYLVGVTFMVPAETFKSFDYKYISPGMFTIQLSKTPNGDTEIIFANFEDEGTGFYSLSRFTPEVATILHKPIQNITSGDIFHAMTELCGSDMTKEIESVGLEMSARTYLTANGTGVIVEPELGNRSGKELISEGKRYGWEIEYFLKGSRFRKVSGLNNPAGKGRWTGTPVSKWVKSTKTPGELTGSEILSNFYNLEGS